MFLLNLALLGFTHHCHQAAQAKTAQTRQGIGMFGKNSGDDAAFDRPGTRFSKAEIKAMRRASRDETGILRDFWERIQSIGRNLPFAMDIVAAAYCALDPVTPVRVKALVVGALAYFVMPIDGIPDFLPFIGFSDDAAVIAATIAAIRAHMLPEHWEKAEAFLRPEEDTCP
jgi:uncharacterized membrane protein YkvA (DUF1232 family)